MEEISKQKLITMLKDEFNRWDALLSSMSEAQATATNLPSNWSIKDVIAHLWAWQQRSVARSVAALRDAEPHYPDWSETLDPDPDEDVDKTNAWIYESNKDRLWADVYVDWKEQFLRFLELSERIPENDMLDPAKYTWMGGYSVGASLIGTYEHHEEHLEQLIAHLNRKET